MNIEQALKLCRDALQDIENPITAMRRNLPEGCVLDGRMAIQIAENPETARVSARRALDATVPDKVKAQQLPVFDFVSALEIADEVFRQYKADHPKWWNRMDGTPILNDVAVRMSTAFAEAAKLAAPAAPESGQSLPDGVE